MEIRPHVTSSLYGNQEISTNRVVLKKDLKHSLDHVNHLLEQALNNPDHINHDLCHELAKSILHLHKLALSGAQSPEITATKDDLKENSSIILNVLEAPIYVS